jgi:hypothetical protein
MDSEMGVGRNWSAAWAESLLKVDASSVASREILDESIASGLRKPSMAGLTLVAIVPS